MILAAGRGERMKPLTDTCPKPLLKVAGKALIEYHIEKLAAIGVKEIVINHAWLGEQLVEQLGNGSQWQVNIHYSEEENGALETAGGIKKALSLLTDENDNSPFLVVNGDVFIDYDFTQMPTLSEPVLAHLWLVNNPAHNLDGDFGLMKGMLVNQSSERFTFSGIALYRPEFFEMLAEDRIERLAPLLRHGAEQGHISASMLPGRWVDVGTPERLAQLNAEVKGIQ